MTPAEAIAAATSLPAPDPAQAALLDPGLWMLESFAISQNDVYTPLIGDGPGPFPLTSDYEARAQAIARDRAALAGDRLAAILNAALR